MIGALETHDGGSIRIMDAELPPINSRRATMLRRNVINYLFQSFALVSELTVYQNLLLSMNFLDISEKKKVDIIDGILDAVHMSPHGNVTVNTLSGGEQRRVALARTMVKPGNLILADEPTGSLDTYAAEVSFSMIQSLSKENNKSVIMVTYSPELAKRADRIIDLVAFH
ncbi:MAG: ABC transporter ATP-binding protein [Actinomycetia bacterium]|nr:ABC transporter ATP-binding protein [Actinomycetes bacterium]